MNFFFCEGCHSQARFALRFVKLPFQGVEVFLHLFSFFLPSESLNIKSLNSASFAILADSGIENFHFIDFEAFDLWHFDSWKRNVVNLTALRAFEMGMGLRLSVVTSGVVVHRERINKTLFAKECECVVNGCF